MNKSIILISANQLKVPYPVYPLGVSYIASHLNDNIPQLKTFLFDYNLGGNDELAELIKKIDPAYIGISLRNVDDVNFYAKESYVNHYRSIVEKIRSCSSCKIIIGGPGYSIFPKEMFEYLKPDFGVYGEGELTISMLLKTLEENNDYRSIPRLIYQEKGKTIQNNRNDFTCSPKLYLNSEWTNYYWKNSGMLNIQTKRGCPYHCIYCTYPLIEGAEIRTLDPKMVVENIKKIYTDQGIDYFFFTDSVFNLKNSYNYELAEELIKSSMNIKWGAYFNFTNLPEDLLTLLKKAGLVHIEFGTDSLSDTTLKAYNKPFTFSDILRISNQCSKLEIDYAHFLILGGYGETLQTLSETFENSKKFQKTVFFPFVGMRIYPNTKLYEIAIEEEKISAEDDLLIPRYYLANNMDIVKMQEMSRNTGKRWVFPDEDSSVIINKMRAKGKKGPLWEYLTK
jgi:radical SAM superfamily enzyme YgiQ (UPF0313 family)